MTSPPRLLILGAHPDDAEFHAGGLAALYARQGSAVKLVSVTDGAAGHHEVWGPPLARRRRDEAAAAARLIGAESEVWPFPDGRLGPTLEVRERIIGELRTFQPDLVLTHRTCDYHPDHRAVGHAVRDASYLVTVPAVVSEVPILRRAPVIAYLPDRFTRPTPIAPDVVVDVTEVLETAVDMLAAHASQVFEWLPFNQGTLDLVPTDAAGRRAWLRGWAGSWPRTLADRYREALVAAYGPQRGQAIEFAEVFEISEYAAPLDAESRARLFPFG
jgi:LmbE family N-acetylglucosaminyl deacetylase